MIPVCSFCHQHGDGKKWYLQAKNYAYDLDSDLRRRGFLTEFVRDFRRHGQETVARLEQLKSLPGPLRRLAARGASRQMQRDHFGQPVPLEDCGRIFDIATSIVRIPCVCRQLAGTRDDALCLAITTRPHTETIRDVYCGYALEPDTAAFDALSHQEALKLLRDCEDLGMMHSVWTFITPFIAGLCNCRMADGCLAMRATLEYGVKVMWKGEYVAACDRDLCVGCGACAKACPFGALQVDSADKKAVVKGPECYGCGVCRAACPKDALSLQDRAAMPALSRDW